MRGTPQLDGERGAEAARQRERDGAGDHGERRRLDVGARAGARHARVDGGVAGAGEGEPALGVDEGEARVDARAHLVHGVGGGGQHAREAVAHRRRDGRRRGDGRARGVDDHRTGRRRGRRGRGGDRRAGDGRRRQRRRRERRRRHGRGHERGGRARRRGRGGRRGRVLLAQLRAARLGDAEDRAPERRDACGERDVDRVDAAADHAERLALALDLVERVDERAHAHVAAQRRRAGERAVRRRQRRGLRARDQAVELRDRRGERVAPRGGQRRHGHRGAPDARELRARGERDRALGRHLRVGRGGGAARGADGAHEHRGVDLLPRPRRGQAREPRGLPRHEDEREQRGDERQHRHARDHEAPAQRVARAGADPRAPQLHARGDGELRGREAGHAGGA
jgi:hypothetical protein